ncbi:MAG: acetate--CoA ligase family protein [Promethearchaeota archaeon]
MLDFFFYPKSIAVIGATANPKKFGNAVTLNIISNTNLESELFLVSHKSKDILGFKSYTSILEIPKEIDLAIILVPAKIVEDVIEECIEKKVKGIIIVTAGFGEIDDKGKLIEQRIAKKCRAAGIRIMGPNCVGIQNLDIGLNASFIQAAPPGHISMISQSGSFGCASFYAMKMENLGCSKFANIGNNIDVSFSEILEFFNNDKNTHIICLYMETVADGRVFLDTLKKIVFNKPIIILKGGRTTKGMKAASSHTGSIVSNYNILKSSIKQAGAILCENTNDYITALKTLYFLPTPQGENIGVLTNSGGSSVLLCDKIEEFKLSLAVFSEELNLKMAPYLYPLVKLINPLDMIAAAAEKQYYEITKLMLEDTSIDIVIACVVIPPFLEMDSLEHFRGIIRAWNDTKRRKPIIPLLFFSQNFQNVKKYAKEEKCTIFFTPQEAALAAKILIQRLRVLSKRKFL